MKLTKTHGNYIMLCIIMLFFILTLGIVNKTHLSVTEASHVLKAQGKDYNYNNKAFIEQQQGIKYPEQISIFDSFLNSWIALFGKSVFMLRLLSILFSCVTLYFLYMIANRVLPVELSLLAVFLLSVNSRFMTNSALVDPGPFLTLCFAITLHYLMNLIEQYDHVNLIFFIGFSLLTIYTSFFGYILLLTCGFFFFLKHSPWKMVNKKKKKNKEDTKDKKKTINVINKKNVINEKKEINEMKYIGLGLIAGFLLAIPKIIPIISFIASQGLPARSGLGLMANPVLYMMGLLQGFYPTTVEIMYLAFSCVIVAAFVLVRKKTGSILLFALVSTIIISYISIFLGVVVYSSYLMFLMPVYVLLIVIGIANIKDSWLQYLLVIALIVITANAMWGLYTRFPETGPAEIASLIKSEYKEGDIVLISPLAYTNIFDFYVDDYNIQRYGLTNRDNTNSSEVRSLLTGHNRVWLVFGTDVGQAGYYQLNSAYDLLKTDYLPAPRIEQSNERLFLLTAVP
jgi:hypothetical protein